MPLIMVTLHTGAKWNDDRAQATQKKMQIENTSLSIKNGIAVA